MQYEYNLLTIPKAMAKFGPRLSPKGPFSRRIGIQDAPSGNETLVDLSGVNPFHEQRARFGSKVRFIFVNLGDSIALLVVTATLEFVRASTHVRIRSIAIIGQNSRTSVLPIGQCGTPGGILGGARRGWVPSRPFTASTKFFPGHAPIQRGRGSEGIVGAIQTGRVGFATKDAVRVFVVIVLHGLIQLGTDKVAGSVFACTFVTWGAAVAGVGEFEASGNEAEGDGESNHDVGGVDEGGRMKR